MSSVGFACVPLILAKLYAVYPRLFQRPLVPRPSLQGLLTVAERGSIAVLVASSLLQLATGVMNVAKWYVFGFGFVAVHWALAWVSIGALVVHIAVKLPVTREALSVPVHAGVLVEGGRDRRWFVRGGLGVAVGAVLLSVGQTWPCVLRCSVSRQPC